MSKANHHGFGPYRTTGKRQSRRRLGPARVPRNKRTGRLGQSRASMVLGQDLAYRNNTSVAASRHIIAVSKGRQFCQYHFRKLRIWISYCVSADSISLTGKRLPQAASAIWISRIGLSPYQTITARSARRAWCSVVPAGRSSRFSPQHGHSIFTLNLLWPELILVLGPFLICSRHAPGVCWPRPQSSHFSVYAPL